MNAGPHLTDKNTIWPRGAPAVGQKAELTREVLKQDIEMFTFISGDYNPLHYDEELAKATKFGRIIVQGEVTLQRNIYVIKFGQSNPFFSVRLIGNQISMKVIFNDLHCPLHAQRSERKHY